MVDLIIEKISFSNNTPKAVIDLKSLVVKRLNRTHRVIDRPFEVLQDIGNDIEVSTPSPLAS
jgi:hypothetical protein